MTEDKVKKFDRLLLDSQRHKENIPLIDLIDPDIKKQVKEYRKAHPEITKKGEEEEEEP